MKKKTKEAIAILHSSFNVCEATYNGFEYKLKLMNPSGLHADITGDPINYDIIWYCINRDEYNIEVRNTIKPPKYFLRYTKRIAKYMSKRMNHYKDPFKGITGWT